MFQFAVIAFGYMDTLLTVVVGSSSHGIGHFGNLREIFLDAYDFTYPFEVAGVPQSVHHAPCLHEFVLLYPVPLQIRRDVLQIGGDASFEAIPIVLYFSFFLFVQLTLYGFLPVFGQLFP